MLDKLKASDFQPHLEEDFELAVGDELLVIQLAEVAELGQSLREGGSFSLVFVKPEGTGIEQGVYPLSHKSFGTLELFLVPIGPFGDGNGYECVFT